jgi:hypothetical protein
VTVAIHFDNTSPFGPGLFTYFLEQFLAYLNDIFDPLLNALSDPSDAVSFF